jgi:hypothetical protein
MNTTLEQLNLNVDKNQKVYVNVYFYPNYTVDVKRYSLYDIYTNKDIYENVSLQNGFEMYLENNIKLFVDKIDYSDLPIIQYRSEEENTKYNNSIQDSLTNYFSKITKIGNFKIKEQKYANFDIKYEIDGAPTDRSIESLFLEGVSAYIIGQRPPFPAWSKVLDGQNLQTDYINIYKKPFGQYSGSLNIGAHLEPGLLKTFQLTFPYESLKTNINYPIMIKNNKIININLAQDSVRSVSKKINYKPITLQ